MNFYKGIDFHSLLWYNQLTIEKGMPMTASAMTTARPPWAVTAWVDANNVYIELPVKDSIPYVMKFALSEAGLSKALWLLRERHEAARPLTRVKDDHPKINRPYPKPTENQRDHARSVLKKLGMI